VIGKKIDRATACEIAMRQLRDAEQEREDAAQMEAGRHSADIDLWMEVDGARIPLSQSGSEFVIAAQPVKIAPGTRAVVCVSVDGRVHQRAVVLTHGSDGVDRMVVIKELRK
jgi:hypothetical protein